MIPIKRSLMRFFAPFSTDRSRRWRSSSDCCRALDATAPTRVMAGSAVGRSMCGALWLDDGLGPTVTVPADGCFLVGRDDVHMDLVLDFDHVSLFHALIVFVDSEKRFFLRDLNSTNSTYINGRDIGLDTVGINDGDVIGFGSVDGSGFTATIRQSY